LRLLAVVSAGYINSGCFSFQYLLVFCYNVAFVGQSSGFVLVEFLLTECLFFFLYFIRFRLCLLIYDILISVSAVPVGASDRVAGLLSRIWWQR
jgi:hypothetical protein